MYGELMWISTEVMVQKIYFKYNKKALPQDVNKYKDSGREGYFFREA